MRKTKIICTIGPASEHEDVLTRMIKAGMDVARLNFSHGSHEEHQGKIDLIKKVRQKLHMPIAIMLDTKGPEYRIKTFENGKIELKDGDTFTLTTDDIVGNQERVSVNYENLIKDLKVGDRVLVANGIIILQVRELKGNDAICDVIAGGTLSDRKSMNFPNKVMKHAYLSKQDKDDLLFGIKNEVDYVAASFVSTKQDVADLRSFLDENGGEDIEIIAKIENRSGVDHVEEICEIANGIMIARGDLGVEIPGVEVPAIQKYLINKCRMLGTRVITATEMLESMIHNPRPTRAEVADVANAIYDGTDAIMLSGETAAGKYPLEALKMMVEIAQTTEPHLHYEDYTHNRNMCGESRVSSAVGLAAVQTARDLKAKAIVTPTFGGRTAILISNFRPEAPIYAVTPNDTILHRLQLVWGVTPLKGYEKDSTEHIISQAMSVVRRKRLAKKGDLIVFTVGDPATNMTREGAVTNMLHVIEAK